MKPLIAGKNVSLSASVIRLSSDIGNEPKKNEEMRKYLSDFDDKG